MSNIFDSLQGGAVSSALAGTDAGAAADTTVQGGAATSPDPHQVETGAATQPAQAGVGEQNPDNQLQPTDGAVKDGVQAGEAEGDKPEDDLGDGGTPDPDKAGEVLKGPKVLREFYETNKPFIEAYAPILEGREISPDLMKAGVELLDNYLGFGEDGAADPEKVLGGLYDLDPAGFNRTMHHFINTNKDYISKALFGVDKAEDIERLKAGGQQAGPQAQATDIEVPEFDPESGDPIPEATRELMRQALERASAAEGKLTSSEKETAQQKEQKEFTDTQRRIDDQVQSYRQARLSSVDPVVKGLGLEVQPGDEQKPGIVGTSLAEDKQTLADIIKNATTSAFGRDKKAQGFYRKAVEALEESGGKPSRKADGLAYNIERAMAEHAKKYGDFITSLVAKATNTQRQQVQQAAAGGKPEVADTGATVTGPTSAQSPEVKPFDHANQLARLEQLVSSGVLPRR